MNIKSILYKNPTNIPLCYSYHFISTALLRHVSAFKGPSSGNTTIHSQNVSVVLPKDGRLKVKTCRSNTVLLKWRE